MNVYLATIIMLLFNAVAATAGSFPAPEEHANSQADAAGQCNAEKSAALETIATTLCHIDGAGIVSARLLKNDQKILHKLQLAHGSWGEGDKLEHVEGAP